MIGKRFGKLRVLRKSESQSPSRDYLFECLCDCGTICLMRASYLKSGNTKNCGCVQKEKSKNRSTTAVFATYKNNAKNRGLKFLLTRKQFEKLIDGNCFYCGNEPLNVLKRGSSVIIYNGIDRLDNNIGYEKDNCVTCCKICNRAKNNMGFVDFLQWIKQISNNYKEVQGGK